MLCFLNIVLFFTEMCFFIDWVYEIIWEAMYLTRDIWEYANVFNNYLCKEILKYNTCYYTFKSKILLLRCFF